MNVFVLCTGRCGSTTFARACAHISNFTAAHESRLQHVGDERLAYADRHIEVDNRLSWLLGRLDEAYGRDAFYVHLTRDEEQVAQSLNVFQERELANRRYQRRWGPILLVRAYGQGILNGTPAEPIAVARDLVRTVTANIKAFLKDKPNRMDFRMEDAATDFPRFWNWIGAEGDLDAAQGEWSKTYNSSGRHRQRSWGTRLLRSVARPLTGSRR